MLATKWSAKNKTFPIIATPKLDGFRCLTIPNRGLVSRTFKPFANKAIQDKFKPLLDLCKASELMLDGELISEEKTGDVFTNTSKAVTAFSGDLSQVKLYLFDTVSLNSDYMSKYTDRLSRLLSMFRLHKSMAFKDCVEVPHTLCNNEKELQAIIDLHISQGYEGTMVRTPYSFYIYGRVKSSSADLAKIKSFEDAEGIIVDFTEKQINNNPQELDAFGYAKRCSKKEGKQAAGTLGSLMLMHAIDGKIDYNRPSFEVGSGFTDEIRDEFWANRDTLVGKIVTYKYQPHGAVDRPRFPVFKSIRDAVEF